jgi:hypothetical protein
MSFLYYILINMPKKLNPWMAHVRKVWQTVKKKGGSYKSALVAAKKTYKKKAQK